MIIAIVVVVGFLAMGVVLFLCLRYCRRKRNQFPPTIPRWSDEIDGVKGLPGFIGTAYAHVPGEPISSSEDKENQTNSFCLISDSGNVSVINMRGVIKSYFALV